MVAMSQPAEAVTRTGDDDSFDFAVLRSPTWVLTATSKVDWGESPTETPPTVSSVNCRGENQQFDFSMNTSREVDWLRIRFLGNTDKDGERDEITLLGDHLFLYIDGERWEYANIPTHSTKFSNVHYPQPESDIILPVWRGYQAVRKTDDQPWLNLKLLYHRLITARQIEWSFKSRDWTVVHKKNVENHLPKGWQNTRYKIDNEGLRTSIFWCAGQVSSDDAYILPARMNGQSSGRQDAR